MEDDRSLSHFIKYNNAIPIALGVLFFMTTGAFAASPAVRDSVYSSSTAVQSVDNSYLLSADIDSYPYSFKVTSVTEDDDNYYVAYDFHTIDVEDAAWRDVARSAVLTIAKSELGGGDLKAYAEDQFSQLKSHEIDRLAETQAKERKAGLSQKIVATAYSGLIGHLITPSDEAYPAYVPPPAEQDPDSPLALAHPIPLVTWDENAATTSAVADRQPVTHEPSVVVPDPGGSTPPATTGTSTPPADTGTSPPSDDGETPPADTGDSSTPPADDGSASAQDAPPAP